jgi:hypothetical protein
MGFTSESPLHTLCHRLLLVLCAIRHNHEEKSWNGIPASMDHRQGNYTMIHENVCGDVSGFAVEVGKGSNAVISVFKFIKLIL